MTKNTNKVQKEVLESANKIWLAGLGALSVAEEEGSKLFKTLVKKGEGFEKRGKKRFEKVQHTVEDQVEAAVEKADSAFGKFGKGFDGKVADTLNKLGVPSRMEIQKLTRRVEQLTRKVDGLSKKPKAKPRTAKKTTRTRASKTA
ncbi:MAG: phasin family protein [bacterium]|nr:phasin family protein [bacterium]